MAASAIPSSFAGQQAAAENTYSGQAGTSAATGPSAEATEARRT